MTNGKIKDSTFFFIDLDGTLLCKGDKIKKGTTKFLADKTNWSISTGRDFSHFSNINLIPKYTIVNNGAQIYKDGEIIFSKEFSKKDITTLINRWEGKILDFSSGSEITNPIEGIVKISLYPKKIDLDLFGDFSFNEYDDHIELMPKNVSKGSAELWLVKFLEDEGFKDFVHIGDSENDVSAKENGIYLVSMRNGNKKIKDNADFISKYKNKNGVHKTIKEILNGR